MKAKIILKCQFCKDEVERVYYTSLATCFNCKTSRNKIRSNARSHATKQKKIEDQLKYQHQITSQRVQSKQCQRCKQLMFNVDKRRLYCSPLSCRRKNYEK